MENNRSDEKNEHYLLKPIRFIVIMAVFGILFEKVDSIKNPWGVTPRKRS